MTTPPADLPKKRPLVVLPAFCPGHLHATVEILGFTEKDPWQAGIVIANMLMFNLVADAHRDGAIVASGLDTLPEAFPDCWACTFPALWQQAGRALFKGLEHASAVSQRSIVDPDCPLHPKSL